MKMLRKIIDGKSWEISQENVYDGVSFSKVPNLQCSHCNFAIKITHHRHFFENVPNTSCLKNPYFKEKKFMLGQLPNKVATLQYAAPVL